MSTRIVYDMVEGDTKRTISNRASLDGTPLDLTDYTIECHQTNIDTGAVVTVSTVTADADQTTNAGVFVTEFQTALVAGTYWLEWEMAHPTTGIITFPGDADERPKQIVRAEAA